MNDECAHWDYNLLRVCALRCSGGSGRPSGQRLCDPWHGEQHRGGDPLPPGGGEHPVRTRFPSRSIHHGPEEGRAGRAKVSRVLKIEPVCQLTIWPLGLCLSSNVQECPLKSGGRLVSRSHTFCSHVKDCLCSYQWLVKCSAILWHKEMMVYRGALNISSAFLACQISLFFSCHLFFIGAWRCRLLTV